MASNKNAYVRNLGGADGPLRMLGLFQAGATQAIKRGEILELSGGNWIPLDADQSMAAIIAVADEEIKSGDRAGYYHILVPRPDDVFKFTRTGSTANPGIGTAVYFSDSQTVTTTTGTNLLARTVSMDHIPKQGHASEDGSPDAGTTLGSLDEVAVVFDADVSYFAAIQPN